MSTKFLICLMVLFSACTSYTDKRLEYALELASENRQELEKVLEHYQNDPEKLMATRFLIENMPRWYGYEGRLLDSIRPVLAAGAKNRYIPKEIITKWQGQPFYLSKKVYDLNVILADYMIENIDQAFEVYKKYPWNKNLPFDDFCELILPYRIGDEPLTDWRRLYRDRYMPLLDSLYPGGTDVVEACRILANELKKESEYYSTDFRLPRLGGEFLLNNRIGYCRESCDITLYVMRACGIPIAIDFFEYSPEYQQGHMWTVVRDTTDKYLPFWYTQFAPRRDMKDDGRKKGKIYRNCFGLQPEPIPGVTANKAIPNLFRNRFVKDATANYSGENHLTIPIGQDAGKYVYLGVFSPRGWIPVDIAKSKKQHATFQNVEQNIIYQPISKNKENEDLHSTGYPFLWTEQGYRLLKPDTTRKEPVRLVRKMPLMPIYRNILKDLIGGRIEGANRADFTDAVLLHEITDTLRYNHIEVIPQRSGMYQYVRYVAPSTYRLELAELTLYADTGCRQQIPLRPMSGQQPVHNPEDLIDGNILTSIGLSVPGAIGLEVTKKARIEKIVFSPPNDDNFVWPGQEYELFYFSGVDGWKSLGRQTAVERELHYDVPANALLWLRNLTKGREEQVFIAENGEQVFIHDINR